MNNSFFWLVFSLFLYLPMKGQEQFTVLYTKGQVQYFSGTTNIGARILSGKLLPARGVVRCEEGAMAKLVFKGKKHELAGGQEYQLATLAQNSNTGNKLGFMGRFWNFIGSSVNNTEDNNKVERYHRRYMADAKGGISGFGERENEIQTFDYLMGPMGGEKVNFIWTPKEGVASYTFEIYQQEDKSLFFKAYPRAHSIVVDLDQLQFKAGEVYTWEVRGKDSSGQEFSSAKIPFSYEAEALAAFMADEERLDELEEVEADEKTLLSVYQLEEEGFLHSAYMHYQQMLADSPDNDLYKRLFAAFLIRMNHLEKARQLVSALD